MKTRIEYAYLKHNALLDKQKQIKNQYIHFRFRFFFISIIQAQATHEAQFI